MGKEREEEEIKERLGGRRVKERERREQRDRVKQREKIIEIEI